MCNIVNDFYGVTERKGIPVVSSRKVAEVFEKQHGHVIRDIEKVLIELLRGGLSNFGESNFIKSSYKNSQNKRQPEYLLTKDGFTLLVMGYTGEKATRFKVAYIERFNQMENFIKSLSDVKADFPEFTDAVMQLYEEPKHYHFSNEINMINRIVLGMDAKKFKEVNGLGDVPSIRPYLSPKQLEYIKILQRVDIGLCVAVKDFHQRKNILQDYFNRIVLKQIA